MVESSWCEGCETKIRSVAAPGPRARGEELTERGPTDHTGPDFSDDGSHATLLVAVGRAGRQLKAVDVVVRCDEPGTSADCQLSLARFGRGFASRSDESEGKVGGDHGT